MIPLRCCVKKYEWGKRGMDSIVARLVKNQLASYEVDPDSPFAEASYLTISLFILFWYFKHPFDHVSNSLRLFQNSLWIFIFTS